MGERERQREGGREGRRGGDGEETWKHRETHEDKGGDRELDSHRESKPPC